MNTELLNNLFKQAADKNLPKGVDSIHRTELLRFVELIVAECVAVLNPNTGDKHFKDQTPEEFWKNQCIYLIQHSGLIALRLQEVTSDTNIKTPKVFNGPYWEDHCPTCGEKAVEGCRCLINDRKCSKGHSWHRVNGRIILGSGHSK